MEASHCFVPTFQQGGGPGFEHLGGAHGEAVAAPRQHRFSPYVDNGGCDRPPPPPPPPPPYTGEPLYRLTLRHASTQPPLYDTLNALWCGMGRTTVAVAGEDFCVVAGDTRMSQGFSILTRDKGKCVQL
jgi:hypothetical protein